MPLAQEEAALTQKMYLIAFLSFLFLFKESQLPTIDDTRMAV